MISTKSSFIVFLSAFALLLGIHPGYGSNFRIFDVLDFIAHVTAHIPERHEKRVIWYGYYSNKSRGMRKKKAQAEGKLPAKSQAEIVAETEDKAPLEIRRAWAYLVSRVYEVDPLVCTNCGGRMQIISYIHDSDVIWRILNHLGLIVEEEAAGSPGRSPPDDETLFPGEITCEPFFDACLDEALAKSGSADLGGG